MAEFDGTSGALHRNYNGHTHLGRGVDGRGGDGSIFTGHFNNRAAAVHPDGRAELAGRLRRQRAGLTVSDGEVIAGGHFQNFCDVGTNCANRSCATTSPRSTLPTAALDRTWAPNVNSDLGVFALADTTVGLALGGDFTNFGGIAQAHLAFLQTGSRGGRPFAADGRHAAGRDPAQGDDDRLGAGAAARALGRQRPERRLLLPAAAQRRRRAASRTSRSPPRPRPRSRCRWRPRRRTATA